MLSSSSEVSLSDVRGFDAPESSASCFRSSNLSTSRPGAEYQQRICRARTRGLCMLGGWGLLRTGGVCAHVSPGMHPSWKVGDYYEQATCQHHEQELNTSNEIAERLPRTRGLCIHPCWEIGDYYEEGVCVRMYPQVCIHVGRLGTITNKVYVRTCIATPTLRSVSAIGSRSAPLPPPTGSPGLPSRGWCGLSRLSGP